MGTLNIYNLEAFSSFQLYTATTSPIDGKLLNSVHLCACPWLRDLAPGMGVEQAELLIAICPVGGVINVQNNMAGNSAETVAEQINQG